MRLLEAGGGVVSAIGVPYRRGRVPSRKHPGTDGTPKAFCPQRLAMRLVCSDSPSTAGSVWRLDQRGHLKINLRFRPHGSTTNRKFLHEIHLFKSQVLRSPFSTHRPGQRSDSLPAGYAKFPRIAH